MINVFAFFIPNKQLLHFKIDSSSTNDEVKSKIVKKISQQYLVLIFSY